MDKIRIIFHIYYGQLIKNTNPMCVLKLSRLVFMTLTFLAGFGVWHQLRERFL